ncbi:MAG: LptF/LptG family permease [Sumerlaeia bacterium]
MTLLPRYLLKEIFGPIVLSSLFFIVVLLIARIFDDIDLLLKAGVSGYVLLQVVGIFIGTLLTLTIPMAVLLGTIMGVGRLTSDNEILAIRIAGISLGRVFAPVIFSVMLLTVVLIGVNQYVVPAFYRQLDRIFYEIQFEIATNLEPGVVYDELAPPGTDMTLTFERKLPSDSGDKALIMEGVSMHFIMDEEVVLEQENAEKKAYIVFAERGSVIGFPEDQRIQLVLENGRWISEEAPSSSRTTVISFAALETFLNAGNDDLEAVLKTRPQELAFSDLLNTLQNPPSVEVFRDDEDGRRIAGVWRDYFRARNEMIQRFTLPLSCLAFVLLAIPLAMEVRPKAKSFSLVLSAVLMSLYYAFFAFAQSAGTTGISLSACLFLFLLPNILMGGIGILYFWRSVSR